MTYVEKILDLSSLSTGTYLEHILSIKTGTGTGIDVPYPVENFKVDFNEVSISANLDIITLSADFNDGVFGADFEQKTISANINNGDI